VWADVWVILVGLDAAEKTIGGWKADRPVSVAGYAATRGESRRDGKIKR